MFDAIYSDTLRNLLDKVNFKKIKKEQVVSILKEGELFLMVYWRDIDKV